MNKILSFFLIVNTCFILGISIAGCTYNEHYYGQEHMVDEGVVVQEKYVVE
ncbi:hypothetical protein J7L67_09255 [bacterium]|nr:hypothetical protein [bacterium]